MTRSYCETEREIILAMGRGSLDPELEKHAGACVICSDTVAVSKFLRTQKAAAPVLTDPDFLWWKAQLATERMATERATRSIVLVRRIAYCGISAAVLWLVLAPGHLMSMLVNLSKYEIWTAGALNQIAMVLAIAALVFTLLGSWYLVRSEK
jgi:hypothetical protein